MEILIHQKRAESSPTPAETQEQHHAMTPEQLKTRCQEIRAIFDSGVQNKIEANGGKIQDFAYAAAGDIQELIESLQSISSSMAGCFHSSPGMNCKCIAGMALANLGKNTFDQ